ncbi:hypothetical protein HDU97_009325 [Phlyctochytrium planicorne]|nr:hypothetical protein HDU97_009325 [Phlyctochytrium planicorne]
MELQLEPQDGHFQFQLDVGKSSLSNGAADTHISGTLNLSNPTRNTLKDINVTLNLRGTAEFTFRDAKTGRMQSVGNPLIMLSQVVFEEKELEAGGKRKVPFGFLVPGKQRMGLPPSMETDGGRVTYAVRAAGSWKAGMGGKKFGETEVPVVALLPEAARARTLALQAPLSVRGPVPKGAQEDDGSLGYKTVKEARDVAFHLIVRRRAVLPGDTFNADLTVWPQPHVRIARVAVSLRSTLRIKNKEGGESQKDANVLSTLMDPAPGRENEWNPRDQLARTNPELLSASQNQVMGALRSLVVPVPTTTAGSLEHPVANLDHILRVEVFAEGKEESIIVVDTEVVIVPRGGARGPNSPPIGFRSDSVGRALPTPADLAMGMEDGVVPYTVLYDFYPSGENEIQLTAGQNVKISDSFADGWGVGQNLATGAVGFMPMQFLNPDLVVGNGSNNAEPQPPSPRSPAPAQPVVAVPAPPAYADSEAQSLNNSMSNLSMNTSSPLRTAQDEKAMLAQRDAVPKAPAVNSMGNLAGSKGGSPYNSASSLATSGSSGRLPPTIQAIAVDGVVTTEAAEAHIGLLHRFILLQSRDQMTDWKFLCRAEQRYLMWLDYLREERPDPNFLPLPPIDVALMWHTHMLSPLRYYEDYYHIFNTSSSPYNFPLKRMHDLPGNGYDPEDGSKEAWESFTGEPYTIAVEGPGADQPFRFRCSWCTAISQVSGEAYVMFRMKDAGIQCPTCQGVSSADNVSAKRFLDDLMSYRESGAPLRGSILDEKTNTVNLSKAVQDLQAVFPNPDMLLNRARQPNAPQVVNWAGVDADMKLHMQQLRQSRALQNKVRQSTLPRVMRCYRNMPVPFSLDLVAGVLRQRKFTSKMVGGAVDWLERDALARASVRYHKFLTLMAKEPGKFLVPTLDIDLMWHTHQLHPYKYQQYGLQNVKHIINHDDSIEQKSLDDAFAATTRLWKRHFRERYASQAQTGKGGRNPAKSLFPGYALFSRNKAGAAGSAQQGGCQTHDASLPVVDRRSSAKFPIGSTQPVSVQQHGVRKQGRNTTVVPGTGTTVVVVGGCASCGYTCMSRGAFMYSPLLFAALYYCGYHWGWGFYGCGFYGCGFYGCGAFAGCGGFACGGGWGGCGGFGGGCGGAGCGGGGCGGGGCGGGGCGGGGCGGGGCGG